MLIEEYLNLAELYRMLCLLTQIQSFCINLRQTLGVPFIRALVRRTARFCQVVWGEGEHEAA